MPSCLSRVVLVLNPGKCGSTWLQAGLRVGPYVHSPGEQDFMLFLSRPLHEQWNRRTIKNPRHLALRANPALTRADKLTALYRWNLPAQGYFVDKSPSNLLFIEHFEHLFRDSKLVFLYRDPRDIYVSKELYHQHVLGIRPHPPNGIGDVGYLASESLLGEVFELSLKLLTTEERLRGAGYAIHRVKYEDLVVDFEATVAAALRFLGLPADASEIRRHLHDCQGEQFDNFRKGGTGDWKNHLGSPAARAFLQKQCGEALDRLGYDQSLV